MPQKKRIEKSKRGNILQSLRLKLLFQCMNHYNCLNVRNVKK